MELSFITFRRAKQGIRIRTLILLWFLLSTVSSVLAQSAGDIDTLSQWRVETSGVGPSGPIFDQFKYYLSGAEVIGSTEYYKVYKSGYWNELYGPRHYYEHEYGGALREQGNVWYTYEDGRDTVLFDFNLEVGDTVISSVNLLNEVIVVDSIAIIQVDGEDKKQIYFTGEFTGEIGFIIQDVGSATGLLQQGLINWFEQFAFLHCYAIDFVPLWINPVGFGCDLTVNIEEFTTKKSISAYPNPFTTSTTIEYEMTEPTHIQLTIYNHLGETVEEAVSAYKLPGVHTYEWNAERLSKGLYFAVLRSEKGVSVVKIVKQ